MVWSQELARNLTVLRAGTESQLVLGAAGDDRRIDWGYIYAAASAWQAKAAIGANETLLESFVEKGELPKSDDQQMPRPASDKTPVLAFVFDLGSVGATTVQRQVIVAYDEVYAIKYYGVKLRPYWRRHGMEPVELLVTALKDYACCASAATSSTGI